MPGIILLNKDILLISVFVGVVLLEKSPYALHGELFLGNTTGRGISP